MVTPEGGSGYWQGGFSFSREKLFYLKADAGKAYFNLKEFHGNLYGASSAMEIKTQYVDMAIWGSFFKLSDIEAMLQNSHFRNEKAAGAFLGTTLSLNLNPITVKPFVCYGDVGWGEGDFYWFFGKPKVNSLWLFGFEANYDKHSLGLCYFPLDIDIISPEEKLLFDGFARGFTLFYRFRVKKQAAEFSATIGYFYLGAGLDGELTSSNQLYAFFPYRFYKASGSLTLNAGFLSADLSYGFSVFRIKALLGAAQIFHGPFSMDIHYLEKNLFGGREDYENMSKNINLGAAFLLVDFGLPSLPLGEKTFLALGLKKLFAVPWGNIDTSSADSSSGSLNTNNALFTFFLSGLSLYLTVSF